MTESTRSAPSGRRSLTQPRLKGHLKVVVVDDDKVFLMSDGNHFLLEGGTAAALVPLLDGTRELADLIGELGAHPPGGVLASVRRLEGLGLLVEGATGPDPSQAAFWDTLDVAPDRVAPAGIALVDFSAVDAEPARKALADAGLECDDDAALAVVLVDDYLDPRLSEFNRQRAETGAPWVLARLTGSTLWLGPHIQPGQTACWACIAERLEGNRQVERYLRTKNGSSRLVQKGTIGLHSAIQAGGSLLAIELQAILAGSPRLDDLVTIDLATLETEHHPVIRQPWCSVCGDPAQRHAENDPRIALRPTPKGYTADGGHRICRPEETFERLQKHISPITGAVTSVRRQTIVDNGVAYSYASGHNFALMQDSLYFLRKNLRGRSGGKGRTDHQAKVGAVCEAIERFNGIYRGNERHVDGSYTRLADRALHPEELLLFSDAQYANRNAWNAAQTTSYHIVPARLDPEREIEWTPVWSLRDEQERLVPAGCCWYGHPDIAAHFYSAADANGCAAGNTVEEAILQGLMELVERDSVAAWWYSRAPRPSVDLDAFDEPYVSLVREHYAELGRNLWVLDITTDLGIPAFVGCSQRLDHPTEDLLIGFGAHVDARMALMRSLTEVNQFLPAVSARKPDGSTHYWMDDADAIEWWTQETLQRNPHVAPHPELPARRPSDFAPIATDDIAEDVRRCVQRIGDAGHDVLVLDQSRPEIELSVVRVISPGLRHFWRRLAAGRLYDVPVKLGWIDAPVPEDQLNPISIFF
jgi:bacteriocin biosynthesis cyclodehydratase domain-containing protein